VQQDIWLLQSSVCVLWFSVYRAHCACDLQYSTPFFSTCSAVTNRKQSFADNHCNNMTQRSDAIHDQVVQAVVAVVVLSYAAYVCEYCLMFPLLHHYHLQTQPHTTLHQYHHQQQYQQQQQLQQYRYRP
jgi:hypothetical protein